MAMDGTNERLTAGKSHKFPHFSFFNYFFLFRNVMAPLNELFSSFARHPRVEVHVVSEFRTSKCCPRCHNAMEFPPRRAKAKKSRKNKKRRKQTGHRYALCRVCNITFNRDLAAPQNILQNGVSQVARMTEEDFAKERKVKNMKGELGAKIY